MGKKKQMAQARNFTSKPHSSENNLQSQSHLVSTDLGIELGSIIRLLITVYFN